MVVTRDNTLPMCCRIKIMPESMTTLLALCGKLCIAAAFNVWFFFS